MTTFSMAGRAFTSFTTGYGGPIPTEAAEIHPAIAEVLADGAYAIEPGDQGIAIGRGKLAKHNAFLQKGFKHAIVFRNLTMKTPVSASTPMSARVHAPWPRTARSTSARIGPVISRRSQISEVPDAILQQIARSGKDCK